MNASMNLYLQMEKAPPSPHRLIEELWRWSGFTLTGEKADDGSDELERSLRPVNPRELRMSIKDYVAQNPNV